MAFELHIYHHFPAAPADPEIKALLNRILRKQELGMSKISEFAEAVNQNLDQINTNLEGLKGDVEFMKAEIEKIQTSAGTLTPEDQASLDAVQARVTSAAEKAAAIDALTEPVTPPTDTPTP